MDSIFVNSVYPFEVNYSFEKKVNGLIVFGDAKKDNDYKMKFLAYGPSFDMVAKGLEEATYINHITGEPFIRTSVLYRETFKTAIVQIEFPENQELETIVMKKADLNNLPYTLVQVVCKKWLKEVL